MKTICYDPSDACARRRILRQMRLSDCLLVESTSDDVSEQRRAYWRLGGLEAWRLGGGVIDLIMKEGVLMKLIEAQPWADAWNEGLMSPGTCL